jgi:GTPase involved in cell partitioning and DNA repair
MVAMVVVIKIQVADGDDKFIRVPLGTVVKDKETGDF